jgi:hypothetical protein
MAELIMAHLAAVPEVAPQVQQRIIVARSAEPQ